MRLAEMDAGQEIPSKKRKLTGDAPNGNTNGERVRVKGTIHSPLAKFESLPLLYSPSVMMKIWGVAQRDLGSIEPPQWYPEYTKPGSTTYVYRDLEFWTSGFFPGSLHLLLERRTKFQNELKLLGCAPESPILPHTLQLEYACKWWTQNLYQNASLLGTHDLGFMITPWARVQWDLFRDQRAFDALMTAADTLADRFSEKAGCVRSWDICKTKCYSFEDPSKDFLVIIDNMMNLDLIFWAASQTSSPSRSAHLFNVALTHARTTRKYHVRDDSSTCHVVNFDPATGDLKERLTNQGFSHPSCWSRGQGWAIAGFAETYKWTGDLSLLQTARDCADYFLRKLPESGIPPWDFDAAENHPNEPQPPDTSAALIAAYGMLLIHQSLLARGELSSYLNAALRIVDAVCTKQLNPEATWRKTPRTIDTVEHGCDTLGGSAEVDIGEGDTIVSGATINNFEFAPRRWADHGLVYADYFFLLVGNKLLEMGVLR